MTLRLCDLCFFKSANSEFLTRGFCGVLFAAVLSAAPTCVAQNKPAANPAPDVLVLANGDTLHGKFVSSIQGTITFHSDPLGDLTLTWDKIKEIHTGEKLAVIDKTVKLHGRKNEGNIPIGTVEVENKAITVHTENAPTPPPIPEENAPYIIDETTLNKQIHQSPGFFQGWYGSATAGATVVTATQNQYAFSGAVALQRVVPTVTWLNPRDRTTVGFLGSYGKITEPSYFAGGTFVPAVTTKTAIYHAEAERDEYLTPRVYVLGQVAYDHNFSQNLDLQQIYGGGIGWTALKTPTQSLDLRATIQYERQQFISGVSETNPNLIGSTFSAAYVLKKKFFTFTQGVEYIPAYNDLSAYSVNETNTLGFVAYKNFGFTLGTLDSYLNNPPISLPPTKRNSFQFTMGLTYTLKSNY
jgi:Protein of unknown function, DUF481